MQYTVKVKKTPESLKTTKDKGDKDGQAHGHKRVNLLSALVLHYISAVTLWFNFYSPLGS